METVGQSNRTIVTMETVGQPNDMVITMETGSTIVTIGHYWNLLGKHEESRFKANKLCDFNVTAWPLWIPGFVFSENNTVEPSDLNTSSNSEIPQSSKQSKLATKI
jgi:hypothetical protein